LGEMISIKVLTALMKDYELPEGAKVTWDEANVEEVSRAAEMFQKYLQEGWMAFSESQTGRKQVFNFNPGLARIVLMPPLGGG
jgi:hypothetical protein